MKNPVIERLKQKAKLYHRTQSRRLYQGGIVVRHVYDVDNPEKMTWWDDTGFILNDYHVGVSWVHPRHAYNTAVEELAHIQTDHLFERARRTTNVDDLFTNTTKQYVKVGKSRKKIKGYLSSGLSMAQNEWYDAFQETRDRLILNNDIVITPSISAEWRDTYKLVSICVPMEMRGVADLKELCVLTKSLLKRETTLAEEFLNYTYTVDDWIRETGSVPTTGIHSHGIA